MLKEIQAKIGFIEKPGPGEASVAEEKFSRRSEKSKRALIALLVVLAVTVAGLGSMAAFYGMEKTKSGFRGRWPGQYHKNSLD